MRTTHLSILTAILLVGTAAALPLNLPTCGVPALEVLCVGVVVGDLVVGPNQAQSEAQFNNGTYAFQGTVTVEEDGRVEIIFSNVAFGEEAQPIHVLAGGTLVIDGSTITALPDGSAPVILVEEGGTVVVQGSDFTAVTLDVRTDDADLGESDYNTFTLGAPAVRLTDFDGIFENNKFTLNEIGVEVSGGTPTLQDLTFDQDTIAIALADTGADLQRIFMEDIQGTGVSSVRSYGTYGPDMVIADALEPPTRGFEIMDTTATVSVIDNDISRWGVGLFQCNADVFLSGNVFHDNLEDFGQC